MQLLPWSQKLGELSWLFLWIMGLFKICLHVVSLEMGQNWIRRREKRASAREKLATEEEFENVEKTANVEVPTTFKKPVAEEADGIVKATVNVVKTEQDEEPTDAKKLKFNSWN